jgi:hypothetical protein
MWYSAPVARRHCGRGPNTLVGPTGQERNGRDKSIHCSRTAGRRGDHRDGIGSVDHDAVQRQQRRQSRRRRVFRHHRRSESDPHRRVRHQHRRDGRLCYADCDGSGDLDFFDFLCFQNAFAAGEPYADCDGSGGLDFFDFLCFQNEFAAGCPDLEARSLSAREVTAVELPGYAIGGVAVGEPPEEIARVVRHTAPLLPEDRPRYLMGVGYERDIAAAVIAGVDMFDCVLPTRNGRNATAFTPEGRLRLRNEQFRADEGPIEAGV